MTIHRFRAGLPALMLQDFDETAIIVAKPAGGRGIEKVD
jgi:hypothetical protein